MVKKYVKVIVAIVFVTNLMAQNVPNYLPTNGLVGWWPFNGNANDESGNGNNGTVNGATLTADRNGNANSSYSFNGSQNIDFGKLQEFKSSSPFTVSIWFKTIYPNQGCLFSRGDYAQMNQIKGQIVTINNNDVVEFGMRGNGFEQNVRSKKTVTDNKWHHAIWSHDGDGKISIYIDGKLENSGIINNLSNLQFNLVLANLGNTGYYFKGLLDDFAVWNRALTQKEITALYTSTPPCTTPSAVITPQGNTTFCQGGFVNLNASTGANYTYEWYNNGQLINGATASVYQATTSGNYTVKVIDGACNATSTATTVTVNQYPSSGVNISGNTTFCEGNNVTLSAQGNGTYLWSNGATSKSITVNQAGSYGVAVTSNGCVSNSNQTTVTVNPNPTATITPQGNTTFCQGGFVNLVASGGTSYQWNTGSSAATISATQSGTYTVNVFNSFGCQATASQQVIVNPLPNVTFNALNQFTLKNASPIQLVASPTGGTFSGDGVQGSTFNPANVTLGKKTITYNYTSPQGCSGKASSNTFVVDSIGNVCNVTKYDTVKVTKTITDTVSVLKVKFKLTTGIKANQYTTMNVYPNPTSDVVIIEASDVVALNGYSYKLVDVQGKELYNALVTNVKTEISLKTFGKAGVYILHVVDANNASIQTKQIILE